MKKEIKYPADAAHIIEILDKYKDVRERVDADVIYYAATEYKKAYLSALDRIAELTHELELLKKNKRGVIK